MGIVFSATMLVVAGPLIRPLGIDSTGLLLILVALALAIFGIIRLAQPLEPKQRVVLVMVFICGLAYLTFTLIQWGVLGQRTD